MKLFLKKYWILILLDILIYICSYFPLFVEQYFSNFVFKYETIPIRYLFSSIPFSIGDILYIGLIIYTIFYLILIIRKKINFKNKIKILLRKTIKFIIIFYFLFNILWGLNYHRVKFLDKLNIQIPSAYSLIDLENLRDTVIVNMNVLRKNISSEELEKMSNQETILQVYNGYNQNVANFEFLKIHNPKIKFSLFSQFGDYINFAGYFNPFTQEGQIRADYPPILNGFIASHELAHQIGYAKEEEANFIAGYICLNSNNKFLKYSAYHNLTLYILNAIHENYAINKDSIGYKKSIQNMYKSMDKLVFKDFKTIQNFLSNKNNSVNKITRNISRLFYDRYLKLNQQSKGIKSYNEIIAWLMVFENGR